MSTGQFASRITWDVVDLYKRWIAVPTLLPAVTAAATALALSSESVPAVAYIGGTMGTLIGADLLNLPHERRLGASLVSIGGAGTFDRVGRRASLGGDAASRRHARADA